MPNKFTDKKWQKMNSEIDLYKYILVEVYAKNIIFEGSNFERKNCKRMNIPEDLKYTKDHEWIKVDGN